VHAIIIILFHTDNIFGCDLTKLVDAEGTNVPKFLVRCTEEIEKRGIVMALLSIASASVFIFSCLYDFISILNDRW